MFFLTNLINQDVDGVYVSAENLTSSFLSINILIRLKTSGAVHIPPKPNAQSDSLYTSGVFSSSAYSGCMDGYTFRHKCQPLEVDSLVHYCEVSHLFST